MRRAHRELFFSCTCVWMMLTIIRQGGRRGRERLLKCLMCYLWYPKNYKMYLCAFIKCKGE